jgi:hypothetical protein
MKKGRFKMGVFFCKAKILYYTVNGINPGNIKIQAPKFKHQIQAPKSKYQYLQYYLLGI